MQNTITLAEMIRLAIHRSGYTAAWIASEMDVSARTVSNWQTGTTMPKFDDIVRLATITGADVADFAEAVTTSNGCYTRGSLRLVPPITGQGELFDPDLPPAAVACAPLAAAA